MLFKRNRDSGLNSADDLGVALCELRLLLFSNFTFFILFVGDKYFFDSSFISDCMYVQDTLVTLGKNRLVAKKLKYFNFSFE